MIISKERAEQIITLAKRTNWDGSGLRDHMTPNECARVEREVYNARNRLSFNDVVRACAK